MFRKKKKMTGKGVEKSVSFRKILNVQNYTPKDYGITPEYLKMMSNPEKYIEKYMKGLALDDQSARLLQVDNLIDSLIMIEKCSKDEQKANHIETIYHMRDVFKGELAMAERYRECLLEDLKRHELELEVIREMQEPTDIVL